MRTLILVAMLMAAMAVTGEPPAFQFTKNTLAWSLPWEDDWVTAVAFLPGGDRVLSGSEDMTLKLWDARTGELVRTFQGQGEQGAVRSVALSPDGSLAASGSGEEPAEDEAGDALGAEMIAEDSPLAPSKPPLLGAGRRPLHPPDRPDGQS